MLSDLLVLYFARSGYITLEAFHSTVGWSVKARFNVRYDLSGIDGTYNLTFTENIQFYCSKQIVTKYILITITQYSIGLATFDKSDICLEIKLVLEMLKAGNMLLIRFILMSPIPKNWQISESPACGAMCMRGKVKKNVAQLIFSDLYCLRFEYKLQYSMMFRSLKRIQTSFFSCYFA